MNRNFEIINGISVDVTTVMNKSIKYTPSADLIDVIYEEGENLLNEYFPDTLKEKHGFDVMFNSYDGVFWRNKGWIISAMEKHPCYNGNLQIVLRNQELSRHINHNDVVEFGKYFFDWLKDNAIFEIDDGITIPGLLRKRYLELLKKLRTCYSPFGFDHLYDPKQYDIVSDAYADLDTATMDKMALFLRKAIRRILNHILNDGVLTVDEWIVTNIKELMSIYDIDENIIKFHEGEKITKFIGKIAKLCGINKHSDIQDVSFTRQDGEVIHRSKDMGWNYQYARFCDAISPIIQHGTLIVSVNPIDYWTMSFGNSWASCHTIDKRNKRRRDSMHNYEGFYCGGTESYMLDESTIMVYSLPEDWDGEHPELEDKIKRCVFYLGEDKLGQSRVYPDGRDGGEASLAGDMRKSIQKLVSELFDVPNYWTNSKGTFACCEVIDSYGVHYRDYEHYDDCNMSYMKRIDGYKNNIKIRVGHNPICPECGETHGGESNIFCYDCKDGKPVECCGCGSLHYLNEMHEIDGEFYCDECVRYCSSCNSYRLIDGGWGDNNWDEFICENCLSEYYTWSDYEDCFIHNENVITTEEGRVCNRRAEGFKICSECGECHNDDETHYDEVTDGYYCNTCYEELLERRRREMENATEEE